MSAPATPPPGALDPLPASEGAETARFSRRNLLAGLGGHGWTALLQFAVVPWLVKFLGIESFGLLGLYLAVQGLVRVLDLGLSPTMNRQMARLSAQPGRADEVHDLLRTVEPGYWTAGAVIGLTLAAAAPLMAAHWIHAGAVPVAEVRRALLLMAALVALQWPLQLYEGCLLGLQRMTALQAVGIAMRTVASAGGVLVLRLAAPTLTAFLLWQMAVSVAHALALAVLLRRSLPAATRSSRFDVAALRSIRRFAAGMSGIAVSGLLLAQADKIVLSRLLDLRSFGYYSLAATVGAGLYVLILPVFGVLFPALSACVAAGDEAGERRVYHLATQTLAASVVPLAAVVAFFAYDVLLLWTGNDEIARCGAPVVQLLLAGTAINGLMNPAYALQLAHGWTRIGLVTNLCLLAGLLPALAWVAPRHGVTGAAALWMGLNAVYMAVGIWRTHRRLLRGAGRVWLLRDVLPPAAGGVLTAAAGWALVRRHGPLSPAPLAVAILAVLVSAWLAAVLAAPRLREWASPQRRPPRGAPGRRDAERRA